MILTDYKKHNYDDLQFVYAYHFHLVYNKFPEPKPKSTKATLLAQIDLLQKIQRR